MQNFINILFILLLLKILYKINFNSNKEFFKFYLYKKLCYLNKEKKYYYFYTLL